MTARRQPSEPRVIASPRARRALRSRGVDPRSLSGSGPGGRIVEADVLGQSATAVSALSPMRRAIARVTATSAATVPQFHLRGELDALALMDARRQLLERSVEQGVRLSISDLILRAMGLALRDNPRANAVWQDDAIRQLDEAHVGLAVNLDDGLLVPVVRGVDRHDVFELARQRGQIVSETRKGRVAGAAGNLAATTLSNLGTTRVDDFAAVIFPPQSSILTAGRIVERPFVVDGQLCARPTLRLTLTVDHRVLDGAPAAQFLGRIVRYLEEPTLLLSNSPPAS